VAALGVNQHRIDAERVDLPLPPQAQIAGAADPVQGVAALEHHAFHAQLTGGFALTGKVLPVAAGQLR